MKFGQGWIGKRTLVKDLIAQSHHCGSDTDSDSLAITLTGTSCWWDWMALLHYSILCPHPCLDYFILLSVLPPAEWAWQSNPSQAGAGLSSSITPPSFYTQSLPRIHWIWEFQSFSICWSNKIRYLRHCYMRLTKRDYMRREGKGKFKACVRIHGDHKGVEKGFLEWECSGVAECKAGSEPLHGGT